MSDKLGTGSPTITYWIGSGDQPLAKLDSQRKVDQAYMNDPTSTELFAVDVAIESDAYWAFGTGGGTVDSWAVTSFSGSTPSTTVRHVRMDSYGGKGTLNLHNHPSNGMQAGSRQIRQST